jgi:23S rRNA (guanosine2251-2'-O)-methyltransferase
LQHQTPIMKKLSLDELGRMSVEELMQAPKVPVVLVLDNVRSQHNIGSIFRTADAFRVEAIYLCGITATPPNREMQKTALGATESVSWKYWDSTILAVNELKESGYYICSIEQTEGSIGLGQFQLPGSPGLAIVFGNEVDGIEQAVVDTSDCCIEIPQYGTKHSLNVAVSAGIVIWDVFNLFLKKMPGLLNQVR